MRRLLAILISFGCVPVLLPAAPVPRAADKPVYYFPTQVGTKWVYDKKGGDEKGHGEIVTKSEEKDGRFLVTVKTMSVDFTEENSSAQYAVSKDGVFTVWIQFGAFLPEKYDPPYCLLTLPHKDGNTWENKIDKALGQKHVAKKIETVKVPAGAFEAIRIESSKDMVTWYAPDVGAVKQDHGSVTVEIKSIEIPKK